MCSINEISGRKLCIMIYDLEKDRLISWQGEFSTGPCSAEISYEAVGPLSAKEEIEVQTHKDENMTSYTVFWDREPPEGFAVADWRGENA